MADILYQPGATFDKNYNSHFKPYLFTVPNDVEKVGRTYYSNSFSKQSEVLLLFNTLCTYNFFLYLYHLIDDHNFHIYTHTK